jgi:ABC-type polysaccharide/polyol phosphate export permease
MEKLTERSLPTWLPMLNPVTPVVMAFQRALYGTASVGVEPNVRSLLPDESSLWYARNLGITLMVALVALALAIRWFDRVEGNFAEVM